MVWSIVLAGMSFSEFGAIAGAILVPVGAIGGAIAFLVSARGSSTIKLLESNIVGLKDQQALSLQSEARCKAELEEHKVRLAVQEGSLATLTNVVTNAQAVADMLARVDQHHIKVEEQFEEVKVALSRLTGADR